MLIDDKDMENNLPDRQVVLSVEAVRKKIGKQWILHDVSFDVREGEVFGFLGPNGAGKTTTIRILVNLIRPTEGQVSICNHVVHKNPELALAYVGSIVENPEVYNYLTGWENLEQFGRMMTHLNQARISEVVEMVGLTQRIHDKVKTYSLGMRQRLGIAQALLGSPKLLILDEPTNGLDPKGINELRGFIRKLARLGMAVVVSSHLLSEIQLLCDRVAIINRGRVLAVGVVDELIENSSSYVIWDLEPRSEGEALLRQRGISIVEAADKVLDHASLTTLGSDSIVAQMSPEHVADIVPMIVSQGISVRAIRKITPTLEQLFLEMTDGENIE